MTDDRRRFEFAYRPGEIACYPGCVTDLEAACERHGWERALVVCGTTVGATPAVMDPVREGLGDRLAGVFDETTPEKYLGTAIEGVRRARAVDADVLVAVGGGSSLDVATVMATLTTHDDPDEAGHRAVDEASLALAAGDPLPVVAVPTTLAGADLSTVAGVTFAHGPDADDPPSGGVGDARLMPAAIRYDADLFRTTPTAVLTASAMNGFDKGVEALYTRNSTPITDGTAARGLRLLRSGLPTLREDPMESDRLDDVLAGIVCVQYGVSEPGAYKLSLVHAFGHGFSRNTEAHQGVVHGIVAPHVLRYLFEEVDGRRDLLAEALGVTAADADATASAVVDAVADVRDGLGLPTRLRAIDGLARSDLDDVAERIVDDPLLATVPAGLDPSVADVRDVLDAAW
ncbi:iron-containing alcohol dehydrogenase [Haloplanus rubicundus]|uniref:Iron-containing alcohol dehydrogenase n=1 Tax=Haloplanus rubicundus TaxID=1547898 RepID=A0A345E473_9EURY|nr:iron-containing alcohol dehydrogenase family protein [Haloplanus rubicundus]AXG06995.1 iron-containing alcohol dehydrogenase [Haloplanus rubicundus]